MQFASHTMSVLICVILHSGLLEIHCNNPKITFQKVIFALKFAFPKAILYLCTIINYL